MLQKKWKLEAGEVCHEQEQRNVEAGQNVGPCVVHDARTMSMPIHKDTGTNTQIHARPYTKTQAQTHRYMHVHTQRRRHN